MTDATSGRGAVPPSTSQMTSTKTTPSTPVSAGATTTMTPPVPESHPETRVETPLPLPISHKRKSASPPEKADSYESGMSMPSSDSQASLDLETNVGYGSFLCPY